MTSISETNQRPCDPCDYLGYDMDEIWEQMRRSQKPADTKPRPETQSPQEETHGSPPQSEILIDFTNRPTDDVIPETSVIPDTTQAPVQPGSYDPALFNSLRDKLNPDVDPIAFEHVIVYLGGVQQKPDTSLHQYSYQDHAANVITGAKTSLHQK